MPYKFDLRLPTKNPQGSTVISEEVANSLIQQIDQQHKVANVTTVDGDYVITVEVSTVSPCTVFAARDTSTGKLRSDLTSPRKKFWSRRGSAEEAVRKFNSTRFRYPAFAKSGPMEVVEFELVEKKA